MDGIADYRFVRPLSDGGHGTFFLARTPARLGLADPEVCVKVLPGADNADGLRRATRELRAFAAVSSPHLVTLLDAGQQDGAFYYAMEYCPLGSLAESAALLERAAIVTAVAAAARGAHALHEAGLVHRGIKPATILLHEGGARLADLGLVQALNPATSMTGLGAIGAVEFMEPGLLAGQQATAGSDVWSLGATLHRALTGTGIYGELPERDPLLCVRTVLTRRPALAASLSEADAALVARCLADDEQDRPPTALAVAEELESSI
ncbi:MAG: serine/threonine-protein kinase [Aeromicrobium sp.]